MPAAGPCFPRGLWVIEYCSGSGGSGGSHRNGDCGGRDGELHAERVRTTSRWRRQSLQARFLQTCGHHSCRSRGEGRLSGSQGTGQGGGWCGELRRVLGRREALPFGLGPGPNLEGRWGQEGEVRRWKLAESRSNVHQWGERPNVRCHGCHQSWQLLGKVDSSQRLPKIPPSAFPAANS